VIGTLGCAVGVGLAVWLGLASSLGQVTWDDTGYRVVDDRTVTVDFDVHRAPGQAVQCQVRALDQSFGVVGVVDVSIPAGQARSVHQRATIRTTSRAVTGTVDSCTAG
jgi:hypothetical protein